MIEDFKTLDDIFNDSLFDDLISELKPKERKMLDPDIEKFNEILEWIKENGEEPQKVTNLKERKLYSRLKGIREDESRKEKFKPFDNLNILGD